MSQNQLRKQSEHNFPSGADCETDYSLFTISTNLQLSVVNVVYDNSILSYNA